MKKFFPIIALCSLIISSKSYGMEDGLPSNLRDLMQALGAEPLASGPGFSVFAPRETKPKYPLLSLYQCSNCKKECTKKCSTCQGAYYCSRECQRASWRKHRSDCKILQSAWNGDQYQMERFFIASVNATETTALSKKSKRMGQDLAFIWLARLLMRNAQDGHCHKEFPIKEEINLSRHYFSCIKRAGLYRAFSEIQVEEHTKAALEWVQDIEKRNTLAAPCSIEHLAKNHMRPEREDPTLFDSPSYWPHARFHGCEVDITTKLLDWCKEKARKKTWEKIEKHVQAHTTEELN